jgi:hypothetical protein
LGACAGGSLESFLLSISAIPQVAWAEGALVDAVSRSAGNARYMVKGSPL